MRIEVHPILDFKKEKEISFIYNGKKLKGYEGDTIASALHAEGVKVLSHSEAYNRPRGFYCGIGNCSSCYMEVNKKPNIKVCVEPLKEGMIVNTQQGKGDIK